MSKLITYPVIPAGAVLFKRNGTTGISDPYVAIEATEDIMVENSGHRHWIPDDIKHLLNITPEQATYYAYIRIGQIGGYDGRQPDYYYLSDQIIHKTVMWSDGTEMREGDHYSLSKDTTILVSEDGWWDRDLKVEPAPRKYNGKIDSVRLLLNEVPAGEKTGLYLIYGDGHKRVHVNDVVKAEAPAPRKEVESKGPTFRSLFVEKTKWKVIVPLQLPGIQTKMVTNANGSHRVTEVVEGAGSVVPIGTEFNAVKGSPYGPNYSSPGIWFQIVFGISGYKFSWVRLSDMKDKVERIVTGTVAADGVEMPNPEDVIPQFFIFDTKRQQYYKNNGEHWDSSGGWCKGEVEFSEKGTRGAKSFKRLGDVRAHVLNASGYYHELPGAENLPEWMGGPKTLDVEDTWEIHKIDKATKVIVEKIELIDTFKRTWRLRDLTVKYGAAVRAIYSDLEKKKKVDEFEAVLVFTKKDPHNHRYYYDDDFLTDVEKAEVEEAIENLDKSEIRKGKSDFQRAFAIKDIATGVMIRLSYTGDLEIALVDLKNMVEIAETPLGGSEIEDQLTD